MPAILSLILKFAGSYWKEILIALAASYVLLLHHEIGVKNETIAQQKSQITQITQANTQLSDAITKQNTAIDALHAAATEQQKQMTSLQSTLTAQQQATQDKVTKLLNQPQPKTCDDAIKYLITNHP